MSAQNDGGPAFPSPIARTPDGYVNSWAEYGMSLRDWFAGMALQGLIAGGNENAVRLVDSSFTTYGDAAYSAADEMIATRNGKEQS